MTQSCHIHVKISKVVGASGGLPQEFVKCIEELIDEHTLYTTEVDDTYTTITIYADAEDSDNLESLFAQISFLAHLSNMVADSI